MTAEDFADRRCSFGQWSLGWVPIVIAPADNRTFASDVQC